LRREATGLAIKPAPEIAGFAIFAGVRFTAKTKVTLQG